MKSICLSQIIEVVRKASALMIPAGFEIEEKDGLANIVTSSDVAVQKFLCSRFVELLPGCSFICEEDVEVLETGNRQDLPGIGYTWIIDPIDGTANYSRGIDHCCISVALKKGDTVIMGVVYSPWREEMFSAERGVGAFLNGKPIHTSGRSFNNSVLCTALSLYRKDLSQMCSDIIMEAYPQCNDIRRFGSAAMELCTVAQGKCEMFFEVRLQPWDYSAGILILEEAGGVATNLDGAHPRFDGPDLVCAGNTPENQARLLEIIRKHIPELPYTD